jgi:hypothetical protein
MITIKNDLRFRNAQLRGKVADLLVGADAALLLKVRSIAEKQSTNDDTIESLKYIHENLRMLAAELVRGGVACPEDFQGM